jgi:hypothetical protein
MATTAYINGQVIDGVGKAYQGERLAWKLQKRSGWTATSSNGGMRMSMW